jgi:hypothetical protein
MVVLPRFGAAVFPDLLEGDPESERPGVNGSKPFFDASLRLCYVGEA